MAFVNVQVRILSPCHAASSQQLFNAGFRVLFDTNAVVKALIEGSEKSEAEWPGTCC